MALPQQMASGIPPGDSREKTSSDRPRDTARRKPIKKRQPESEAASPLPRVPAPAARSRFPRAFPPRPRFPLGAERHAKLSMRDVVYIYRARTGAGACDFVISQVRHSTLRSCGREGEKEGAPVTELCPTSMYEETAEIADLIRNGT